MTDWKATWKQIRVWRNEGLDVGLATVVATWGSSPRPVGSHLILNEKGHMEGSVSGGCVEGAVIAALEEIMAGAAPRLLDFSVSSEQAWEVGLSCGGSMRVFVENIAQKQHLIDDILTSVEGKILTTDMMSGVTSLADNTAGLVESMLQSNGEKLVFQHLLMPPLELIIVGAVHISQAMILMAEVLGIHVAVIDPRGVFASPDRFQGVELVQDWPDDALKSREITKATAVVTLTHDPKLDDAALTQALRSPAFYIASLGSRKTHAARLERLKAQGFNDADTARIHGPAGLNIGAKTPAEIALSILAQIVTIYRHRGSL